MKSTWLLAAPIILVAMSYGWAPAELVQTAQKEKNVEKNSWQKLVDPERAGKVPVVLRVRLLRREGSNKYGWDKVKLIGVIKNTSHFKFPEEFEVAHYSGESGIPDGESTVYLEPYNPKSESLWRLLEGSGTKGVSHQSADARE
jgi:hypothetical protein